MTSEQINKDDQIAIEQERKFVLYVDLRDSVSKAWLVRHMLGMGEASTFYGAPGCGKGVIIEDMCLHIAAGWEWHGRPVTRGAVVYIALERRQLVKRRAMAFRKKNTTSTNCPSPSSAASTIFVIRAPRC